MTGFTPFMEHFRHLRRGDCSSIKGSYHDVVSTRVVDPCLVVGKDAIVQVLEFITKSTHCSCCEMTQITFSKAGVLSRNYFPSSER
jgi:hypothetical protein